MSVDRLFLWGLMTALFVAVFEFGYLPIHWVGPNSARREVLEGLATRGSWTLLVFESPG